MVLVDVGEQGEKVGAGRAEEEREGDGNEGAEDGNEGGETCEFPGVETGPLLEGVTGRESFMGGHWDWSRGGRG